MGQWEMDNSDHVDAIVYFYFERFALLTGKDFE